MIESSTFWLRVAASLYAVGLLHSLLTVVRQGRTAFGVAMTAFRLAVVLHGVAIVDLVLANGRMPIENFYQTLSLCAFLTAFVFVILERKYPFDSAAVLLFPVVFGMTLVAAMEQPVSPVDQSLRDVWLVVHILLVIAGYAAIMFTGVAAIAYLVQERHLKQKQPSAVLERLPPLATLDAMLTKSLGLGFALLTLGLLLGITWAVINLQADWMADPRITVSVVTWALLLLTILLRSTAGWRGRKVAWMTLMVWGASALTWATHANLGASLQP